MNGVDKMDTEGNSKEGKLEGGGVGVRLGEGLTRVEKIMVLDWG